MKEEKFPHTRTPLHWWRHAGGKLWSHGGERSNRGVEGKAERFLHRGSVPQDTPKHTTGCSPAHQKDKIQPHPPEHRHQSPPPGSLHNPLSQPYPLGADTKNNGNYELAASEK